jgi:phosphomannomutase
MQLFVRENGFSGGIAITAGHNPEEWNALKFVRPDGMYFNALQGEELLDVYHQGEFVKAKWDELFPVIQQGIAIDAHVAHILKNVNAGVIRSRRFKVALDCCNGACSLASSRLLERLGCQVFAINDDLSEHMPHDPNPTGGNLSQLKALLKASQADIGFGHDTDGERLGIVTEKGEALHQEKTLALLARVLLERKPGIVVTNFSTTRMVDDLAARFGGSVVRTPVGQAFVAGRAKELNATVGGEGSGGVVIPIVQYTNDSLAVIAVLLEYLAVRGCTISQMNADLPRYVMKKRDIQLPPYQIFTTLQNLRSEWEGRDAEADFTDGIKWEWPDGWLHIRASNTESLIRIIAEAREEARAVELMDKALAQLRVAG